MCVQCMLDEHGSVCAICGDMTAARLEFDAVERPMGLTSCCCKTSKVNRVQHNSRQVGPSKVSQPR